MSDSVPPEFEKLLRRFYDAFNARDIDAALATTHPDVSWPNLATGGRIRGHDALRAYWAEAMSLVIAQIEVRDMKIEAGKRVAVDGRHRLCDERGRELANYTMRHVFSFREGLIARMDVAGY